MPQAEKAEKPVRELLQEQSEELKSYIDRKHREMEELLAESEGRLSANPPTVKFFMNFPSPCLFFST